MMLMLLRERGIEQNVLRMQPLFCSCVVPLEEQHPNGTDSKQKGPKFFSCCPLLDLLLQEMNQPSFVTKHLII